MTKVDIIIPQFNNCEYTINLLESIKDCTEDYRIILIDNGSEQNEYEATMVALEDHSHFVIRNPENLGFIKGVNQGIASSTADYVVLQNNDTIVEPGWLDKMLECFDDPAVGLVGPTTELAASWQNRDKLPASFFRQKTREINGMLAFFCVVIKRDVITKIGYLSEEFGLGFGDDDDYCERAKNAGFKLVLRTDVTVIHYHRTTFKKYIPNWEDTQQTNIDFFKAKYKKKPH
jgi:GT2 family glycosyltransferase